MADNIFRRETMDKLSTPDDLDRALEASSSWHWMAMVACGVVLIGAIVWSSLTRVPVFVEGSGILVGTSEVLEFNISAPADGRVSRLLVEPSQMVQPHEIIGKMEIEEIDKQIEDMQAHISDYHSKYKAILNFQKTAREQNAEVEKKRDLEMQGRFASLNERIKRQEGQEERKRKLAEQGYVPRSELEDLRTQIEMTQDEIYVTQRTLTESVLQQTQLFIQDERELLDLDLQIREKSRELELLQGQALKDGVIRTPYRGIVSEIKVDNGQFVTRNDVLVSLIPTPGELVEEDINELRQGIVFIKATEGKKIRKGMAVKLLPSVYEEQDYGQIEGRVREISRVSLTDDGLHRLLKNKRLINTLVEEDAPFKVIVDLEIEQNNITGLRWSASTGPDTPLEFGTIVHNKIVVDRVRLIELAIPAIKQFFTPEEYLPENEGRSADGMTGQASAPSQIE